MAHVYILTKVDYMCVMLSTYVPLKKNMPMAIRWNTIDHILMVSSALFLPKGDAKSNNKVLLIIIN